MVKISKYIIPALAISLTVSACSGDAEQETSASNTAVIKNVQTASVKKVNFQQSVFASGKLASKEESKLSFKTGGIIKKLYVSEGQTVRKGQLLAALDLDEINAQVQQAKLGEDQASISIENAKLALQLAERDYRNAQALYQDSVATLEQFENAEIQLNNAKNQLAAAEKGLAFSQQGVEVANFNLKYSQIIAPANGIILRKVAEVNELVGPGTPVFLFGSKEKAQVIRVSITDKDIIHIALGNDARVEFDAYPNEVFKGKVREIASLADPLTNTFEVEIEVNSGNKKLLSGFIGTVNILTSEAQDVFELPMDALLSADKNQGVVFTIKDGRAVQTPIMIHKIMNEKLLVSKGIDDTDEVVISGVNYLESDDTVAISQ